VNEGIRGCDGTGRILAAHVHEPNACSWCKAMDKSDEDDYRQPNPTRFPPSVSLVRSDNNTVERQLFGMSGSIAWIGTHFWANTMHPLALKPRRIA
jgi:hypothetical protein